MDGGIGFVRQVSNELQFFYMVRGSENRNRIILSLLFFLKWSVTSLKDVNENQ